MSISKVHPSELLELTTLSAHVTSHHLDKSWSDHHDPAASKETGSIDLPTQSSGGNALLASQNEHHMTFRQGVRLYPKAVAWSAMISLAIVMEGYDTALVTSLYAFDEFQRSYGSLVAGHYQISTKWQAALSNGAVASSIIGLLVSGIATERFGYRRTMMGASLLLAAFVFLSFFAFNIKTLLAYQILCGLPWGCFSTLTTAYAAEVLPMNMRVFLTSVVNLCWLLGQVTALGVLRAFIHWHSPWSYRVPFGLQWIWVVLVFAAALFAPESPWWLIQHGRKAEAEKALQRLSRRDVGINLMDTVAIMEHTNAAEKRFQSKRDVSNQTFGDTSYFECFRGRNLRRTEIACMIFICQNLCGLPIIGYAAYFYTQLGFDEARSFDLTMGMHGLGILGSLFALFLSRWIGRRVLYLAGLGLCCLILIIAGSVSVLRETTATLWAMAGLLMTFIFVFDASVGPITYCLIAEIPSSRLRVKTVVLARIAYNISGLVTNILIQRMLNPSAWNWRGRTCFFCAVTCGLCLIYCFFRLPETRGLGFHELDILFEKNASARKFARLQRILAQNNYYSFSESSGSNLENGGDRDSVVAIWH